MTETQIYIQIEGLEKHRGKLMQQQTDWGGCILLQNWPLIAK